LLGEPAEDKQVRQDYVDGQVAHDDEIPMAHPVEVDRIEQ